MAATYEPINTTTLGSAQSTVTFSSIPSTYTDLIVVMNIKGTGSPQYPSMRFNSDSGANYSRTILTANGSSAASSRGTSETAANINYNSLAQSNFNYLSITQIMNYSNTSTYKTQLTRANNASTGLDAVVTLWQNTSAINSITFINNTGTYDVGCTFSLYGIKAA